jgi:hypothetical protein
MDSATRDVSEATEKLTNDDRVARGGREREAAMVHHSTSGGEDAASTPDARLGRPRMTREDALAFVAANPGEDGGWTAITHRHARLDRDQSFEELLEMVEVAPTREALCNLAVWVAEGVLWRYGTELHPQLRVAVESQKFCDMLTSCDYELPAPVGQLLDEARRRGNPVG